MLQVIQLQRGGYQVVLDRPFQGDPTLLESRALRFSHMSPDRLTLTFVEQEGITITDEPWQAGKPNGHHVAYQLLVELWRMGYIDEEPQAGKQYMRSAASA